MPETIIESTLTGKLDFKLLAKWLNNESIEDLPDNCSLSCCNRNEFVGYFLSFLRTQSDSVLQTNTNAIQILQHSTPEKLFNTHRKHHRSISDPTSDERKDCLSVKSEQRSHESPSREKKRGRRVKTKLFTDDKGNQSVNSVSSDESRLSAGVDRLVISSTPMKNGVILTEYPNLVSPVTPRSFSKDFERCDTPRLGHRSRNEKSCLGDYIVNAKTSSKKKKSKDAELNLDLSNSETFPEIGARKSSSLRSEKRRIKPTNIDKREKSLSLNSFTPEAFQHSPLALEVNSAFRYTQPKETTNMFEERNILKQERHKLMEKFHILTSNTSPKALNMPTIKITKKDSTDCTQNYVKADSNKVYLKDKLDVIINVYEILLKNNLILSINTEIYFLISILMSKQRESDYIDVETKLIDNNIDVILKSVHNCTYFAVKSLWNLRVFLELILDKNSLKTLGENKKVRSFYPDLAKFLLNCYGLRREAESTVDKRPSAVCGNVVCFNPETDRADNFPSTMSFHSFKRQRDMFYDILRWYQETLTTGASRSSFRARVKALLSSGPCAANHAHLAALFLAHMTTECLNNTQESKISKLQRRLTCPAGAESHRLPHFTDKEMFYKEFINHAENESFRVHLRDAFATEIVALDSTHIPVEDRSNSTNIDLSKEYLALIKTLTLLSKFLGYMTSLPYTYNCDISKGNMNVARNEQKDLRFTAPKDKVLENEMALRNYGMTLTASPASSLQMYCRGTNHTSLLASFEVVHCTGSVQNVIIPWLIHYLSMLDYTSLRVKYNQDLLKSLLDIYQNRLNIETFKKNTCIYLKSILGWLFDLPHFPQELFYENRSSCIDCSELCIDNLDLVDESTIFELCPCLRDVNVLLSTCKMSQEQKEMATYRHITPVSLNVNPQDRIRTKEKELQTRLEEELLKSQPSSTRRVLELVIERVTSAAIKELTANQLNEARERATQIAKRMVKNNCGDTESLLSSLRSLYSEQLEKLRTEALSLCSDSVSARATIALTALLPTAPLPLHALAARGARNRLTKWFNDNWNTTAILCKDIEAEMNAFLAIGDVTVPQVKNKIHVDEITSSADHFDRVHISPATCIIRMKEQICLLLDDDEIRDMTSLLANCAIGCSVNNLFNRPPTQRAILQLSIDLCVVYASKKPKEVTDTFLMKFHDVWNSCCPDRKKSPPIELSLPERRAELSPEFRNFDDDERVITPVSDDENHQIVKNDENQSIDAENVSCYLIDSDSNIIGTDVNSIGIDQENNLSLNMTNVNNNVTTRIDSKYMTPERNKPLTIKPESIGKSISPDPGPVTPDSTIIKSLVGQPQSITGESQSITAETKSITSETKSITSETVNCTGEEGSDEYLEFFDRILCPRNIVLLSASGGVQSDVWEAMATVLVFLLKNDYLSEDSLTEQCLAVYRQDWPQAILENLSNCMKSVSSRWSRSSTGKFTLFLDFLAEYCGDMDYEPDLES
ncbi:hypothetical protein K1T71_000879 [Dendrolimus kikuchii]|uniref:Uncharacterized protein n=1 Tax=Dendrolimus kikuchii TaxID=765133 RepID=A0ACC1DG34_9NEOP|nr:hypothetical protein K1T71_000879 [Dendrolimus kikuchii]